MVLEQLSGRIPVDYQEVLIITAASTGRQR